MKSMFTAISTGPSTHLDHLAPLCELLNISLIVTEKSHYDLGKKFYPMVDLRYLPLSELSLEYIAKHFTAILTTGKFWAMQLKAPLKMFFNKEPSFLFAPHGKSDKEDLLNQPIEQEHSLHYDDQEISIGNLRYFFYQKYQEHFDALAAPFFQTEKKTVLYAPTWATTATGTSFFDNASTVIEQLKDQYHLLIKLHPLLEENDPVSFHRILGKYDKEVTFIEEFPPVYPILEKTDIYLGDFSSVGYDFLHYNRPMFFLKEGGRLQRCGKKYEGSIDDPQNELGQLRAKAYREAFAVTDPEKIAAQIKPFYSLSESSSSRTTARGSSC
jgi:hypothetical protein